MSNLKYALDTRGLLARRTLSTDVDSLLQPLEGGVVPDGSDVRGTAQLLVDSHALGFLSLTLVPPTPGIPFRLVSDQAAGTFWLWLILSDAAPAKPLFGSAAGLVVPHVDVPGVRGHRKHQEGQGLTQTRTRSRRIPGGRLDARTVGSWP